MKSRRPFFSSYRIKLPITSSAKEGSSHCIRAWRQAWFIHSSLSHQFSSLFLSLCRHRENSHSSFPFIAICVALCKYNIHFLFSYITLGTSILGHIHIFPSPFSRSLFFIVVKCLAKLQVLLYVTHVKLGYFFNYKFAHPRSMKIFFKI